MNQIFIILTALISLDSFSSENPLLKINPYSLESFEKEIPLSIKRERIIYRDVNSYTKKTGPEFKEIKNIDYHIVLPYLIEIIQEQNQEIEMLKKRLNQN